MNSLSLLLQPHIKSMKYNSKPKSLNSRFISKNVNEFNPMDHESVGQTDSHEIFCCPYCIERRGKSDNDGKFYWSREKLLGFCFKCEAVGVLKSDKPVHELILNMSIESFKTYYITRQNLIEYNTKDVLKPMDFTKLSGHLTDYGTEFLDNRIPFYSQIADQLNLQELPNTGIVFPFYIDNEIRSYSIRLFNPTTKMKYYIAKGIEKAPYSPNRILFEGNTVNEVTLVEGCFDAIAAYMDGYENPIALQGIHISDYIISLLRRASVKKINIYLDDFDKSLNLKRKIQNLFPLVQKFNIIYTYGDDPEEEFKRRFGRALVNGDTNFLESVVNRINNLNT